MATIYTSMPKDEPGHRGEYVVGQCLNAFSNPGLELWFNVNYIPGVTDLDLVLFDNNAGYYLVEIKSMKLSAIEEFTSTSFVLTPGEKKQHPVTQLRTGSIKLREYLRKNSDLRDNNLPFIQSTVLWSEITRREWRHRFKDTEMQDFDEMCLFKDDLQTYGEFTSALKNLWEHPILGTRAPLKSRGEHGNGIAFRKALSPDGHKISITKPMAEEIKRPIGESRSIAEKYAPGFSHLVSIQGAPGTGKTTILREIGLANLAAGARVLYVCFNKVLAADQKREFQIMRKHTENYGFIDVYDVWELYKTLGHHGGINKEEQVEENVVAFMKTAEGNSFIKYDVILVDESQDLPDTLFRVIENIARPNASWFVAYGKGQELHNISSDESLASPWLQDFLTKATPEHRRRSFRNSPKAFLIGQAFWEKYPSIEEAKKWLSEKFSQQSSPDLQFELDLNLPQTKNDFKIEIMPQGSLRKLAIRNLIIQAIHDSRLAQRGSDLLIGVLKPPSNHQDGESDNLKSSYVLVREAMLEVSTEFSIPFHDLIPTTQRRDVPEVGAVRLVSLQSIRGLSASHVIIFDLAQLEKWTQKSSGRAKPPLSNLGYIALSRSRASSIVVIDGQLDSLIESFIYELSTHATVLSLGGTRVH
jgi:AAA domain/Nuclease-related domain